MSETGPLDSKNLSEHQIAMVDQLSSVLCAIFANAIDNVVDAAMAVPPVGKHRRIVTDEMARSTVEIGDDVREAIRTIISGAALLGYTTGLKDGKRMLKEGGSE